MRKTSNSSFTLPKQINNKTLKIMFLIKTGLYKLFFVEVKKLQQK